MLRYLLLSLVILHLFCAPEEGPQQEKVGLAPEEKPAEQQDLKLEIRKMLDSLIEKLADSEFKVRDNAHKKIEAILKKRIDKPEELKSLVSFLKERLSETEDADVLLRLERITRLFSIYINWGITSEVLSKFPDVAERLTSSDANVRIKMAGELAWWGKPATVPPLIRMLKDENPDIRRSVAKVLGRIGNGRAVQPLTEALKDRRRQVRCSAAYALGKCDEVNTPALKCGA